MRHKHTLLALSFCVLAGCVSRANEATGNSNAPDNPGCRAPAASPANEIELTELDWPSTSFWFTDAEKRPAGLTDPPPLRAPEPPEPASLDEAFRRVLETPDPAWIHYKTWRPIARDGAGFLKLLHERWQEGRDNRSVHEHVSVLLCAFILKASNDSLRRDLEGKWNSPTRLDIDWLLDLLEDSFALGGNYADLLLSITGETWTLAEHERTTLVFLSRLRDVRPGEAAKWGRALRRFKAAGPEFRADMCRCYHAAYDSLLRDEETGKLAIRSSIAFGEGAYSETARVRDDIVMAAWRNFCPEAAAFAAHVIEVEFSYRPEILTSARFCIKELNPAWPETLETLQAALRRDDAWLNLAALDYLAATQLDANSLIADIRRFAEGFREDLRLAANQALTSRGLNVVPVKPFRMTDPIVQRLSDLCPVELARARRVIVQKHPGWLLPDGTEWVFVSDELDYCFGSLDFLAPLELDFASELARLPAQVRARREARDEFKLSPGFGYWVIGHPIHDVLKLLYAVAWEREHASTDFPLSSAVYTELIQDFASQADLEARAAYDLTWQCALKCINAFSDDHDRAARAIATTIPRYRPWARPQTDTARWLWQAEAIKRDLDARKTVYATTDATSLDYWIERLPEVHVAQYMQPGGAGIVEDELGVAAHIYSYRLDAVWPLVDALDNHDRLVRGNSYWRDFARGRTLYSTGNIAAWLLSSILRSEIGYDVDHDYYLPANRSILRAWLEQALMLAAKPR
jgi:hypothetical protein